MPLGKELKAQTNIAKKQYWKLDNTFEFDKIIKKQKPTLQNYSKSDLICDGNYSFFKYYSNVKKFDKLNPQKENKRKKKLTDLCNDLLATYFNEYNELSDTKRNKMKYKDDPAKLFLEIYNYNVWSENEESSDTTRKSGKKESAFIWHATTRRWWRSERRKRIRSFNSKQSINQISNTINTNKS